MADIRFLKLGRYVINPNLITSIEVNTGGGSTVKLSGGDSVRLKKDETEKLMSQVTPLN